MLLQSSSAEAPGITLHHGPLYGELYPKSCRTSTVFQLTDLEFADDAVLFAPTRVAAVLLTLFDCTCTEFGLAVNFSKTKFLVAGVAATAGDAEPFSIRGSDVEHVDSFVYLGAVITGDTRSRREVDRRIASASRAFGAMRPVLLDRNISFPTRRLLYTTYVLPVLLYGPECSCVSWMHFITTASGRCLGCRGRTSGRSACRQRHCGSDGETPSLCQSWSSVVVCSGWDMWRGWTIPISLNRCCFHAYPRPDLPASRVGGGRMWWLAIFARSA